MPLLDLRAHLSDVVADNPFLDPVTHMVEVGGEEDGPEHEAHEAHEAEEVDRDEFLHDDFDASGLGEDYLSRGYYDPLAPARLSLLDHLRNQLRLQRLDARDKRITEEIIGNVNLEGFLTCSVDDVLEALEKQRQAAPDDFPDQDPEGWPEGWKREWREGYGAVRRSEVTRMLSVVQDFEPSGVGARDLRETLMLQLRDRGRMATLPWNIVSFHFDDLANRRWREIADALEVSPDEVQDAADEIAKLDPKPGLQYADTSEPWVMPDLTVRKVDGEYRVSHDETFLPRLKISCLYDDMASNPDWFHGENKRLANERVRNGRWMIRAIEQRRETVVRVMEAIVERQRDFLEKGIEHLRPLTLRDVAKRIEMHESTVSRATKDKHVQTPRGLYPLSFFFSGGYSTAAGEDLSAESVRARIRKMVFDENPKVPLSDSEIAARLQEDGVEIARRTVAKYRDQLGILATRYRKRV